MLGNLRSKLFIILAAALLSGGCGADDGGESRPTVDSGPTPVLEGTSKELHDLLDRGTLVAYKAGYITRSPEGEDGDGAVIYNLPPSTRIDTVSGERQEVTSMVIRDNDRTPTISCTSRGDAWNCYEVDPLGPSLLRAASPVIYLDARELAGLQVTEQPPRTIAGQAARCFLLESVSEQEASPAEYCLTADGIPLFVSSPNGVVEAWAVSAEVTDADFVSPAEPQRQ